MAGEHGWSDIKAHIPEDGKGVKLKQGGGVAVFPYKGGDGFQIQFRRPWPEEREFDPHLIVVCGLEDGEAETNIGLSNEAALALHHLLEVVLAENASRFIEKAPLPDEQS